MIKGYVREGPLSNCICNYMIVWFLRSLGYIPLEAFRFVNEASLVCNQFGLGHTAQVQ